VGASRTKPSSKRENGAPLGFEAKLRQAADALRNNMDAAEYKHVVLGLIFKQRLGRLTRTRDQVESSG
jgi:type I restriction enzyme M protein